MLPFIDEVINTIVEHEVYTILDKFSGYHYISITPKNQHKITFVTNWEAFVCVAHDAILVSKMDHPLIKRQ
jgi:hypothetical protein